jgi:hypothetical protein
LAFLPTDIFARIVCPKHSPPVDRFTTPTDKYVSCYLHPDVAVSGSENFDEWPTTYHGTSLDVVRSILVHGQLLMAGDTMLDGTKIGRANAEEHWKPAIFTNPDVVGAEIMAETATFDDGKTEFAVLVRLRQKPGSYVVHAGQGFGGFDLWATDRRGTQYIEALDVLVKKAKNREEPPTSIVVQPMKYITSFVCPIQRQAFEILKLLNLPTSIFDGRHNRCYCKSCYPPHWASSMTVAKEKYAIPRGWTRFGLAVNPVFAHVNDIWRSWPIAFHGCHPSNVESIVKNRCLLIPKDLLSDGKEVRPNFESFKENCYFLSPEVGYASHAWYAKPIKFKASDGSWKHFQTILMFRIRGETVEKKEETEGGNTKLYDDYSIISEDEVEWYSDRRGCTHPYGLLIRTVDAANVTELCNFFKLSDDLVLPEHNLFK